MPDDEKELRFDGRGLRWGLALGAAVGFVSKDLGLTSLVSYWGDRSLLVLAGAALGALLWGAQFRRVVTAGALAGGFLWLAVAFTPLSAQLAAGLTRRDPPERADAVFVASSSLHPDGEPTPPAESRLLHGLELLGEARAPRLILSELRPPHPSYAAVARKLMANLGLDQELLTVGPVATTREEALRLGALFKDRGWRKVLLVTSPTHSLRASLAMEHEGLSVVSDPAVETRFDLERLDRPDDRLAAFGSVIHERLGTWVYRWRGWIF